jgi:hypothetical protein
MWGKGVCGEWECVGDDGRGCVRGLEGEGDDGRGMCVSGGDVGQGCVRGAVMCRVK